MSTKGLTVVELCVTVLIVAILSVWLGGSIVRMLKLRESNREEGYMREKLALICAEAADYLSMANAITSVSNQYPESVKVAPTLAR